ncbi:noncanonical pyrimidine nucleotidase, YjjG family [Echinicola strongylocentroti]|uniref:Noncanonical pyrimidine nucleotidase, YjjG family n=1 Tax=Echinicola strongylocentroti TaxID=1795355 RepID=A0A2Z4IKG5_9BACT|nr:YjjG family noncanonical pyrimidine nucleotidase [Echinicola strongylocentroti]AWW30863.1 noncanonical pyrimidine nucleotidase, YjjG family [Echinicola strongylocentroti]
MKQYKHLFFDLDHTLWDYDRNVQESLSELYEIYALEGLGVPTNHDFYNTFLQVNYGLWEHYNVGTMDKATLRKERFRRIFDEFGAHDVPVPKAMEEDFMKRTSSKPHLFRYSKEILNYLHPKYELHIITNGFDESQALKMTSSGIQSFFQLVVTSETTGHKKPDKRIFEYAMNQLGTSPDECLMIGDNLISDIEGARNASIDQVFFNPSKLNNELTATYTISDLEELKKIL